LLRHDEDAVSDEAERNENQRAPQRVEIAESREKCTHDRALSSQLNLR